MYFLPKIGSSVAPDNYQMNMNLIKKLVKDLKEINYQGSVVLWIWRTTIT